MLLSHDYITKKLLTEFIIISLMVNLVYCLCMYTGRIFDSLPQIFGWCEGRDICYSHQLTLHAFGTHGVVGRAVAYTHSVFVHYHPNGTVSNKKNIHIFINKFIQSYVRIIVSDHIVSRLDRCHFA
jgi:hypothetical protein